MLMMLIGIWLTALEPRGDELLHVTVSPQFAVAPATVKLAVRLHPHEDDRALRVEADSGLFFRSSEIQLDGTDEPAVHRIQLKSLPAGEYEVTIVLQRGSSTAATAVRRIEVIGYGPESSNPYRFGVVQYGERR